MKFNVHPTGVTKQRQHKFDVILEEDSGEPLMTVRAWRLAVNMKFLLPPASYTMKGATFNIVDIHSPRFHDLILKALLKKIDPDGSKRAEADDSD